MKFLSKSLRFRFDQREHSAKKKKKIIEKYLSINLTNWWRIRWTFKKVQKKFQTCQYHFIHLNHNETYRFYWNNIPII